MIEPVAEALGNTVAISRKSYVHPRLIDAVQDRPARSAEWDGAAAAAAWLSAAEAGFLDFLKRRRAAGKSCRLNLRSVPVTLRP